MSSRSSPATSPTTVLPEPAIEMRALAVRPTVESPAVVSSRSGPKVSPIVALPTRSSTRTSEPLGTVTLMNSLPSRLSLMWEKSNHFFQSQTLVLSTSLPETRSWPPSCLTVSPATISRGPETSTFIGPSWTFTLTEPTMSSTRSVLVLKLLVGHTTQPESAPAAGSTRSAATAAPISMECLPLRMSFVSVSATRQSGRRFAVWLRAKPKSAGHLLGDT